MAAGESVVGYMMVPLQIAFVIMGLLQLRVSATTFNTHPFPSSFLLTILPVDTLVDPRTNTTNASAPSEPEKPSTTSVEITPVETSTNDTTPVQDSEKESESENSSASVVTTFLSTSLFSTAVFVVFYL